jgi:HK97 family phage major capsid protein
MAALEETVKDLNDKRMKAWEANKALLDRIASDKRGMTAEEKTQYDRADQEITELDNARNAFLNDETRQREIEGLDAEYRRIAGDQAVDAANQRQRVDMVDFFRRPSEGRSNAFAELDLRPAARAQQAYRDGARGDELRLIAGDTGASGGSLTIPTTVASTIYAFMTAQVALRRMRTTILTTDSGNPISFPRVTTHGIATQVANQNTTFAGTDPVLGQMTLNAFDSGQLVAVGNDLLEDSGSDILNFVAKNVGRAIGQHTAQWYVTGTGSGQPQGVMTAGAVGQGGTIGLGGAATLANQQSITMEKLIDTVYSVVDSYRNGGAEWLMRDVTGGTVRKIRDGAGGTIGQFIWQPSPTVGLYGGQPDLLLGYPVFFDPYVASLASNAKIAVFGDFSAFYIRDTRQLRFERSDDLYFDKNQIAFRALLRTDSDLIDTQALNTVNVNV